MPPSRAVPPPHVEWPTVILAGLCYGGWALAVFWLAQLSPWLSVPVLALLLALHSSLSHEALHGHPFPNRHWNEALVALPLGLFVPYARFRDLHLEHHRDSDLTDPYDDPETNYLDPAVWRALPPWRRHLARANNTLLGRMVLGPAIGTISFVAADLARIRAGDRAVARTWVWHMLLGAAVLWAVAAGPMPLWAYVLGSYAGFAILKIRTFAEHRAHEKVRARTVIVEDRGLLAFLFLNNNLHVVHHMHPRAPWYALPRLYRARAAHYRACNDHYVFRSYAELFRRHFLRAKDPVPHPLWPTA
ncbi:fatty acid desaturase [Marinibacterium profundimaris]|uniref:Fatty acid desaturase n=1 Tax=Marinibacterium profundimaris TaxID=1679460 RepID=A0A225NCJ2_9RHOB|nr:fatty acid desaturase [Marinibacterium profundimaris]OWU69016.1 fatty acid desaturase [Marinibacterium profundimaris]